MIWIALALPRVKPEERSQRSETSQPGSLVPELMVTSTSIHQLSMTLMKLQMV